MSSSARALRRSTLAALLILLSLVWILWQAAVWRPEQVGPALEPGSPAPQGSYGLYFTNPGGEARTGGPDAALAAAIDAAQHSIHVAVYELDLWSVRDALIRAHARGVQVRVVTDSDSLGLPEVGQLAAAGIEVRGDELESLMHHKFVVIDAEQVWTGSMNLTLSGAYRNNNNLVMFRSVDLAGRYLAEFEQMQTDGRFGIFSLAQQPAPAIQLGPVSLQVLFSPDQDVEASILQALGAAQQSIRFLAFNLTLDSISNALIEKSLAGVSVRGVLEASQANNRGSDLQKLLEAGIQVRLDGNPAKMHHKVIVIDGRTVITGSYNFSQSAQERNDENVLLIAGFEIAEQYLIEFERIWGQATD